MTSMNRQLKPRSSCLRPVAKLVPYYKHITFKVDVSHDKNYLLNVKNGFESGNDAIQVLDVAIKYFTTKITQLFKF